MNATKTTDHCEKCQTDTQWVLCDYHREGGHIVVKEFCIVCFKQRTRKVLFEHWVITH